MSPRFVVSRNGVRVMHVHGVRVCFDFYLCVFFSVFSSSSSPVVSFFFAESRWALIASRSHRHVYMPSG